MHERVNKHVHNFILASMVLCTTEYRNVGIYRRISNHRNIREKRKYSDPMGRSFPVYFFLGLTAENVRLLMVRRFEL